MIYVALTAAVVGMVATVVLHYFRFRKPSEE